MVMAYIAMRDSILNYVADVAATKTPSTIDLALSGNIKTTFYQYYIAKRLLEQIAQT